MCCSVSAKSLNMFNLFLPLAGFPVILPSDIFFRRPSCLRICLHQLCIRIQMVSKILHFIYSLQYIHICHLILPDTLFHSSSSPHFKDLKPLCQLMTMCTSLFRPRSRDLSLPIVKLTLQEIHLFPLYLAL